MSEELKSLSVFEIIVFAFFVNVVGIAVIVGVSRFLTIRKSKKRDENGILESWKIWHFRYFCPCGWTTMVSDKPLLFASFAFCPDCGAVKPTHANAKTYKWLDGKWIKAAGES